MRNEFQNVGQFKWRDNIIINFIFRFLLGGLVGVVIMSLMVAAKRGYKDV